MAGRELDRSTLQSFVDEMTEPAAILDAEDRLLHVNDAALLLLARPATALLGASLGELCPELGAARAPGRSQVLETYCEPSDRWYETTLGRVCDGLTLGLTRDITERKRDAELREHLFGILGHEIRNPLAAITLSLSLFEGAALTDEQQRSIERIGNCVRSLRRLTSDILDIARSRSGVPLPIMRRRTDLAAICRDIIEELRYHGRAIELAVRGDASGDWDRERLGQVLTNLLLNAIQYSRAGTAINVVVVGGADATSLDVVNRGDALPEPLLARVFDPLRRTPSRSDGMGLGLYIVRLIVQAHHGQVGVESSEEETRFWVRLPREPALAAPSSGVA